MGKPRNPFKGQRNYNDNFEPPRQAEKATAWSKFQEDRMKAQYELIKPTIESADKKRIIKPKEENHKKFLIKEKQKEETVWETFSGDDEARDNTNQSSRNRRSYPSTSSGKKDNFSSVKGGRISKKDNPFTAAPSTAYEKNKYRKAITAGILFAGGADLNHAVKQMKRDLDNNKTKNKFKKY